MTDFQKIQGAWEVQDVRQDGERAADASLAKMIIIKNDWLAFRYWLPRSKEYGDLVEQFKLDESKTPKRIEMTSKEDGSVHFGIYELDGGILKFCWRRDDRSNPPTDFTCLKGSNTRLFVLQRVPSEAR